MLWIVGGAFDPHLDEVGRAAVALGRDHRLVRVGVQCEPRVHFTLEGDLWVDGASVSPTGLFLRHDVFGWLADPRPAVSQRAKAWWSAWVGWASTRPDVRLHNRRAIGVHVPKLTMLLRARAAGLQVPRTVVSNDVARLAADPSRVAKPVAGGGYCVPVRDGIEASEDLAGALPAPAIVQDRLVAPELRIYLVGDATFAFEVRSTQLDYRDDPASTVHPVAPPPDIVRRLRRLADDVGLDLCAADLKTCPRSGELVFLELNGQPMWQAFDHAVDGAMSRCIVTQLMPDEVG